MIKRLTALTTNQRLALLAALLGVGAVFAQPTFGSSVRVAPGTIAEMTQRGADKVRPRELADWIIAGTREFRLVDLRDEDAFRAYHIPGAENVPVTALADAGIGRNETIVLYSDDGAQAAQAWFLLKALRFNGACVLDGGLEGWKRDVLFPLLEERPDAAGQAENARLAAVSARFGGTPRTAAAAAGVAAAPLPAPAPMPTIEAPTLPAGATRAAAAKKKKEGC